MAKQGHTEEYKRGFHCGYETARQKFENKPKKIEPDMSRLKDLCAIPPQGEWVWLGDNPSPSHKWSCNKCGRGVKEQENFCPNCGAEMRGAEND